MTLIRAVFWNKALDNSQELWTLARLKGVLNIAEFEGLDGAMRQSLELTGIDIQRIQHEPSNDIWATFDGRIIDGPVLQKNKDGRRYARCIVAVERSIRKKEGDQYVPYPPMEVAVTIWDAEDRTALADNESLFRFDKGLLSFEQLETDDGFKPGLSLDIEARNVYPAPEPKPGVTRALEDSNG